MVVHPDRLKQNKPQRYILQKRWKKTEVFKGFAQVLRYGGAISEFFFQTRQWNEEVAWKMNVHLEHGRQTDGGSAKKQRSSVQRWLSCCKFSRVWTWKEHWWEQSDECWWRAVSLWNYWPSRQEWPPAMQLAFSPLSWDFLDTPHTLPIASSHRYILPPQHTGSYSDLEWGYHETTTSDTT